MATEPRSASISKFPLRLMASVRQTAQLFSEKEGVSLNQFINVAVAEKLARLEQQEWARSREQASPELAARALALLDKAATNVVASGDELPLSYKRPRGR